MISPNAGRCSVSQCNVSEGLNLQQMSVRASASWQRNSITQGYDHIPCRLRFSETWRGVICLFTNFMIFGKWPNWRTIFFYVFISILYMFRVTSCSSSGESIVSTQHLVYVTVCRWPFRVQVGKEHVPDVVLIQLILLMVSTRFLETCREMK